MKVRILINTAKSQYNMYKLTNSISYYHTALKCLRMAKKLQLEHEKTIAEIEKTLEIAYKRVA